MTFDIVFVLALALAALGGPHRRMFVPCPIVALPSPFLKYGVTVPGIERGEQDITPPRGERHGRPADILYVRGAAERLPDLGRPQRLVAPRERTRRQLDLLLLIAAAIFIPIFWPS